LKALDIEPDLKMGDCWGMNINSSGAATALG